MRNDFGKHPSWRLSAHVQHVANLRMTYARPCDKRAKLRATAGYFVVLVVQLGFNLLFLQFVEPPMVLKQLRKELGTDVSIKTLVVRPLAGVFELAYDFTGFPDLAPWANDTDGVVNVTVAAGSANVYLPHRAGANHLL